MRFSGPGTDTACRAFGWLTVVGLSVLNSMARAF